MIRCAWASNAAAIEYHDTEWGVPSHDDAHLFEMLTLEGAQAGLSWDTILRKRDGYREAFARFDPRLVAKFTESDVERLVGDASIVRHRGKIISTVINAQLVLELQSEFGSFDTYLWQFTDGRSIQNRWTRLADLPARTTESDSMSKALKARGFKFVGSTVCYALMQAIGMVNDHTTDCFRHSQLS